MKDFTKPLVSVITPMYNRENTIQRAVESVLTQTYPNIELIIVDDGSTDMSVKAIEKYLNQQVRLIALPHNYGANKARNVGMKAAKGDYIAFQDSDDEWLPDKLAIQIDYMKSKGYKALFCSHILYLRNGKVQQVPSESKMQEIKHEGISNILRKGNVISTQTLVIEKEIIQSVGLFDEMMPRLQDYEYVIRIVRKYDIGFIERPLVNLYRQENSITNNISALYKATEILLEKHGDFLNLEMLLENSMPLKTLDYDEKFGTSMQKLRQLYAKQDREKETIFNDTVINILGKKYINEKRKDIDAKRKDTIYLKARISQLRGREFAIYGSGIIAKRVFSELKHKALYPQYFIVSKKEKDTEEYIDDIPVMEISNVDNKNIVVIVAVSAKYQEEILDSLIKWNFENYFILNDINLIV